MDKLIYPTVNLFLYDLRDGMGQSSEQIYENRLNFWRKSRPEIDRSYKRIQEIHKQKQENPQPLSDRTLLEVENLNTKIQDILQPLAKDENSEAESVELDYQPFAENYLDGSYFALQLGDIYCLQVDASDVTNAQEPAKRTDTPRSLDQISALKKLVFSKVNHHSQAKKFDSDKIATLGQTWLVWGQATAGNTTDDALKAIAEKCFSKIIPNENWQSNFTEIGELIGAKVFEYSQISAEDYHLIILLFPGDRTPTNDLRKRIADITFDLIKLCAYRHKIIWSYWNSRKLKTKLKENSQEITTLRQQIENYRQNTFDLSKLEETLKKSWLLLAEYTTSLTKLNSQGHTIAINLGNYEKRLATIEKKALPNQPVKLSTCQNFVTTAKERYLQQVQMDHISLSGGLTILENLIRTLDTLVNIERTKVESGRNNTIAIAGLGLAASSAFAGITATQVYQPNNDGKEIVPWTSASSETARIHWVQGLSFSLIPVAFTLLIWLYFKKKWEK